MRKKKEKKKVEETKVEEPEVDYSWKKIKFFSSIGEMEEANAKEQAGLSPEVHLQNATELIKRVYAKELMKK